MPITDHQALNVHIAQLQIQAKLEVCVKVDAPPLSQVERLSIDWKLANENTFHRARKLADARGMITEGPMSLTSEHFLGL